MNEQLNSKTKNPLKSCSSFGGLCFRLLLSEFYFLFPFSHLRMRLRRYVKTKFASTPVATGKRIDNRTNNFLTPFRYLIGFDSTIIIPYLFHEVKGLDKQNK